MTTQERVLKKLAQVKRPVRAKVKKVRKKVVRVAPKQGTDKYAKILEKLGKHFGDRAIPDLLEFISNQKDKHSKK